MTTGWRETGKKVISKLFAGVVAIIISVAFGLGIETIVARSAARRAHAIHIGDNKSVVAQVLGKPTCIIDPLPEAGTNVVAALLSVPSETWVYGRPFYLAQAFRSEFPYLSPGNAIPFRIFGPESNDISIEFSQSGLVTRINIP